jgi:1,4-dihydroxy-2-naphthoyl-CoA hydrolase
MADEPREQTDFFAELNAANSGFARAMDFKYVRASGDEVVVEWTVQEQHLQPFGIVHGGVHAGAIETICSIGASLAARARGHDGNVVGLENTTSFLRAVRVGIQLRARALPLTRGRTTHVWSAEITDPDGRLVATGRVRLLVLSPEALAAIPPPKP